MPFRIYLVLVVLLPLISSCYRMRNIASQQPESLPPVQLVGVANAPGDQPPLIKTQNGYVVQSLPGVTPPPAAPLQYKVYVGPSN